jgi:hypothetical protein
MPKTIHESKMLERVRRWRAEAYELLRREPEAQRRQRTREWATRLNLPMLDEGGSADHGADPPMAE